MERQSFLKNHADTIAIIGVNIGLAAITISLWISNSQRIDACNSRTDAALMRIDGMYHYLMSKEEAHRVQWDHNSGFRPYEDRVRIPVEDWMIKDSSVKKGEVK